MWTFELPVALDHPTFAGHFPGQPLLPGVSLLAETMEAALGVPELARLLGPAPRLAQVKFLSPVRPGACLTLMLDVVPRGLRFEIKQADRVAAAGQFEAAA